MEKRTSKIKHMQHHHAAILTFWLHVQYQMIILLTRIKNCHILDVVELWHLHIQTLHELVSIVPPYKLVLQSRAPDHSLLIDQLDPVAH